ncbi:uncharacterized protein FA14DRAFT_184307 [Meira miltonrushii]|uniref:Uncharacterized protein n=1 Tax=Meira miltonrushii TaxID=1280837 RepID=A0A316VBU3_9BASI|nr:uncharacterized protein FA14DRAFT_184307 [Meira miltonrushii]PWN34940.1 hypothetical protein FA14DRAFT_184307 [Meira miltonrushii]
MALAGSPRDARIKSKEQLPTQRPMLPDLNEMPPVVDETSPHHEQQYSERVSAKAAEAQPNRIATTTSKKKKKKLRQPNSQRPYASLTNEEKKAYSRYQTIKTRERFNKMTMLKSWLIMSVFIYIRLEVGFCVDFESNTPAASSPSRDNGLKDKDNLPDLNVPLDGLFAEQDTNTEPTTGSAYSRRMSKLRKVGKLEEYKARERERLRKQYHTLSPAQKLARSRKSGTQLNARLNKDMVLRESLKKSRLDSSRRFRVRERAEKEGKALGPAYAKRKPGRPITTTSPLNGKDDSHAGQ